MDNETTPPSQAEDKTSVDMDKETGSPAKAGDRKSAEVVASSLEEPKSLEKVSDEEKSDDEYPEGLKLFFIMLGLCLAVFLIAIGKPPPLIDRERLQADANRQQTKQLS